jgi:hypothetical protein
MKALENDFIIFPNESVSVIFCFLVLGFTSTNSAFFINIIYLFGFISMDWIVTSIFSSLIPLPLYLNYFNTSNLF